MGGLRAEKGPRPGVVRGACWAQQRNSIAESCRVGHLTIDLTSNGSHRRHADPPRRAGARWDGQARVAGRGQPYHDCILKISPRGPLSRFGGLRSGNVRKARRQGAKRATPSFSQLPPTKGPCSVSMQVQQTHLLVKAPWQTHTKNGKPTRQRQSKECKVCRAGLGQCSGSAAWGDKDSEASEHSVTRMQTRAEKVCKGRQWRG